MNLLSVGSVADKGLYFLFGKNEVVTLNSQFKVVGRGQRDTKNGLYRFLVLSNPHLINELQVNLDDSFLWH
jgi:lipoate-protein ligase A